MHVEEFVILHFAFLQINYQHKGLTKSLKKSVKIFPLMSMAFNHVVYYCSKTENFFTFLLKSHILFVYFAIKLQVCLFVSLKNHTKIWQESGESSVQGSMVLISIAS